LYRARMQATTAQTLAAALAGLSLSHTIAVAVLNGFVTKTKPFFRTPKMAKNQAIVRSIIAARQEVLLAILLWAAIIGTALRPDADSLDMLLWIGFLFTQSLAYLAALIVSLISAMPQLSGRWIGKIAVPQETLELENAENAPTGATK
jgi:hypothetical protein